MNKATLQEAIRRTIKKPSIVLETDELASVGITDPSTFYAQRIFEGYTEYDLGIPYLEFQLINNYLITIPREERGVSYFEDKGIRTSAGGIEIFFPQLCDFFTLTNLEAVEDIIQVDEDKRYLVPIEKAEANFFFRVRSKRWGFLSVNMDAQHPQIEDVVQRYLNTINTRMSQCQGFLPALKGRRQHRLIFKDLENLFDEHGVDYIRSSF